MEKVIIILDGVSEGKTEFINTIKKNNYWCWNINASNFLSMIAYKLGFNGERNKQYFDFIKEFEALANRYWDFENNYIENLIQKFLSKPKVMVLLVHNCKQELSKKLQDKYENCFNILISDSDETNENYCKVLNCQSEGFEETILRVMKILTKEIGETNEV